MNGLSAFDGSPGPATAVITDSGLGGLLICADLESRLRRSAPDGPVRLIYVNAWPEAGQGYNDLPDLEARAAVFDRALDAMTSLRPGLILIACNTLSIVYESTAFSRAPAVPVTGILEEGAELFGRALARDPSGRLILFGTRTTVGSGEHLRRLAGRGADPGRVIAEACHGLAGVIDKDPDSSAVAGLVGECVARAARRLPPGGTLYAGLACTHYAYVGQVFLEALSRQTGSAVEVLDPGRGLVDRLTCSLDRRRPGSGDRPVTVEVVSKVELPESQRRAVAARVEPVSPAAARALLDYARKPHLF
jgi:glutamate racemase